MTTTYSTEQQTSDKANGLPVAPCPCCGKRANIGVLRSLGLCMTCAASVPNDVRVSYWAKRASI